MGCLGPVSKRSWPTSKLSARIGPGWGLLSAGGSSCHGAKKRACQHPQQQQRQQQQPSHAAGPGKQQRLAPTWDNPAYVNVNTVSNKNVKISSTERQYIFKEHSLDPAVSSAVLSHLQSDGCGVAIERHDMARVPLSLQLRSCVPRERVGDVCVWVTLGICTTRASNSAHMPSL